MAVATPPSKDPLRLIRSFPKSPHIDASTIGGNVELEHKQLCANAFSRFFLSGSHGSEIVRRVRWLESNVWKEGEGTSNHKGTRVVILGEVEVTKDMCNVSGILAGSCTAHLVDLWSINAMAQLGVITNVDATGVSQTLNTTFHNPAYPGQMLRLVGTSLTVNDNPAAGTCEIYEKESGKLVASCSQTAAKPRR